MADMIGHPHDNAVTLQCRASIQPEEFRKEYVARNLPLHIPALASDWPAMEKWSFQYIANLGPELEVGAAVGDFFNDRTQFKRQTLGEYVQLLVSGEPDAGYLAVFQMFKAFPQLIEDVDFSLLSSAMPLNHPMGWLGPAGSISGYHIDWAENIVAQICGRKRFYLVAPDQTRKMYPGKKYDYLSLVSQVDARNYDDRRFPLFREANVLGVTLQPGDVLYIPRGWWHYAESLEPSISVNNFSYRWLGCILDLPIGMVKVVLHRLGLYGRDCACHERINGRRVAR